MKTNLCVLSGIALLLSLSPAARCEDNSGRLLSQKPAQPAAAAAPQIKSSSPSDVAGGEKLTLSGTGFSTTGKDNTVSIGDKAATVQGATATAITVIVPKDCKPGKQKVTVSINGAKSNTIEVTINGPPPELDGVSLSSAAPGSSLTISGKNFSTNAHENKVTIGGASAEVSSASTTSLSVMIPQGIESPQEAQISVTVGKQQAKNSLTIMIQSREY